ncbi:hypothetical protein F1737_01030 [Methanoplanus sp. FWC-SCC4]|uniref:Copper amine oxidase n=1 Tax=Methanochimaera problematica TaxID=2609417 RepID=A0AA97FBT6_9EURY|nr:beta-propeller domain-containing protein [Methanoplanus sp. FWC-SCC4]WOF15363.1 hypothetical protein F1737_01030 [Methanoplanus sp. FWC-SCC4]
MDEDTHFKIFISLIVIGAAIVAGIFAYAIFFYEGDPAYDSDEIIKVSTEEELESFLNTYQKKHEYSPLDYLGGGFLTTQKSQEVVYATGDTAPVPMEAPPVTPAPTLVPTSAPVVIPDSEYASDYSTTNIQVEDVDEADFVKNDNKYIYIVKNKHLIITDAYPAKDAEIVFDGRIEGIRAHDIFLNNDRLVVFGENRTEEWRTPKGSAAPVLFTNINTNAWIYNIKDRKNPEILYTIELPGDYENARMIGNFVYAITQKSVNRYEENLIPAVKVNGVVADRADIWCPPIGEYNYVMYTATSFDLKNPKPQSESFLMGWSNTFYMSKDNIYMAYSRHTPYEEPVFTGETDNTGDIRLKTVIHRFSVDKGDIKYAATGLVPGRLLNQWSMDEYDKNLRAATTTDISGGEGPNRYNNVYVLNPGLEIIGKLEYIAPDEKIYSARFMGDLLYLVTFKQIDPFFVIDLSNPKQPGILGELKIPGYSDYLHPYDKNHIIGIGRSTEENKWGGVSAAGLKIALFDVTDLNNPGLVDSVEIGEAGTESPVLRDHRAFLFDIHKNILVLPVYEVTKIPVENSRYPDSYSRGTWNGAYVFGINPDSGFELKGKIEQSKAGNTYWYTNDMIQRSLFMDNVIYTISNERIIMSSMLKPEQKINEIILPKDGEVFYGYNV